MFSRKFFAVLLVLSLFVFGTPVGLAQESLNVDVKASSGIVLNDDVYLTIEVTDSAGKGVSDHEPVVDFDPLENIYDDVVYDCNDPDYYEDCQVNNRAVAGVFEAVFTLMRSPVTVNVNVNGVVKVFSLSTEGLATVSGGDILSTGASTTSVAAGAGETTSGGTSVTGVSSAVTNTVGTSTSGVVGTVSPGDIKVGPYPSVWIILIPMALVFGVVTFFVVKTE